MIILRPVRTPEYNGNLQASLDTGILGSKQKRKKEKCHIVAIYIRVVDFSYNPLFLLIIFTFSKPIVIQ